MLFLLYDIFYRRIFSRTLVWRQREAMTELNGNISSQNSHIEASHSKMTAGQAGDDIVC